MRLSHLAYVAAFFVGAAVSTCQLSHAHSWYPQSCCGDGDCKPLEDNGTVRETADEYIINEKWHFNKAMAQPSKDGRFHYCINTGSPICIFVPQSA